VAAGRSWKKVNGLFLPQSRGAWDKSQGVFMQLGRQRFVLPWVQGVLLGYGIK
jgi:hypothetical protein